MAASSTQAQAEGASARPRRSWSSIAWSIIKGLVALTMALLLIASLGEGDSNPVGFFNTLFVTMLAGVSLAYLLFVSSRVHLQVPGLDISADEPGSGVMAKLRRGRRRAERQDHTVTVQVSRLGSGVSRISVRNDAPLPVLHAEASVELAQEPEDGSDGEQGVAKHIRGAAFSLRAHSVWPTTVSHVFEHVGIYRLHSAGIRIYDLLGLFSRTRDAYGVRRVRVVPNIYRLSSGIPRQRKVFQTSLGIPDSPADALDYDRVRDYRPGDPLKTIHWKLVAHSNGELYTKLFETPTISTMALVLDPFGADASVGSRDLAYHLHDTMLEGGFSLIEHARENDVRGRLRYYNREGSLVEADWVGPGQLGWFVETAQRPAQTREALQRSVHAIQSLQEMQAGSVIFATSGLTEESVQALIACHQMGVPLLVVHALPDSSRPRYEQQRLLDERLQEALIGVVGLMDGPQIVEEVLAS